MTPAPAAPRATVTGRLLVLLLKTVWVGFVVSTPLLGVWVASSLAAYSNGPVWLAVLSGLVLFPVGPLAWELLAAWRHARKKTPRPRVLTAGDRFVLRTLALNVAFLAALVATHPQKGFLALSTRGDWMLDGRHDARAEQARRGLFAAAGGLEWLYVAVRPNPYRRFQDASSTQVHPQHGSAGEPGGEGAHLTHAGEGEGTRAQEGHGDEGRPRPWPSPATLHPVVANMPASAETDIEAVGRYIAERESDPLGRVRALHDWVADRIAYDAPAYAAGNITQADADPETVFRTRVAVCAGYARLMAALGRAAGVEVVYVVGDARTGATRAESHAWNAVKVEDRWYLLDATWDAGSVSGTSFHKAYRSEYFLAPPEVFGVDHFPDDPEWQLRDVPVSRGEFLRQPWLRPGFYARGLALRAPERSQVEAHGAAELELANPQGQHLMVDFGPSAGGATAACAVDNGPTVRARCAMPAAGSFVVRLFGAGAEFAAHEFLGQLEVNNRL